jgi:hypothetical protein
MSIIIKYGESISRSPLNTSKAHQMYSFPKAERFPKIKTFGHADAFYDLPSVSSKRKTTFGFGIKSDFTKKDKNLTSKYYQTLRDFDKDCKLGKYYTFGQPREKYGKVYVEGHKNVDKNVPGPGKYFLPKPFGWDAPKFSFKGKYDDAKTKVKNFQKNEEERKKKDLEYKEKIERVKKGEDKLPIPLEMSDKGKYPVSTIRNISSFNYGHDKSKRSGYVFNKYPGPGKYDSKQLLGKIFDSKYKTYEGFSMGSRHDVKDSRHNYPGPGSYILPSEFGIYKSKDADNYPQENVYPETKKEFEDKAWRHNMKKIDPEELKRRKELYLGEYYLDDDDNDDDDNKKKEEEDKNELSFNEKEDQDEVKPEDEAEQIGKNEKERKEENEGNANDEPKGEVNNEENEGNANNEAEGEVNNEEKGEVKNEEKGEVNNEENEGNANNEAEGEVNNEEKGEGNNEEKGGNDDIEKIEREVNEENKDDGSGGEKNEENKKIVFFEDEEKDEVKPQDEAAQAT